MKLTSPANHSPEEKRFLGTVIPAGNADGTESLRLRARHAVQAPQRRPLHRPATDPAPGDEQPEPGDYVKRVAATSFADNGVWRAWRHEGGGHAGAQRLRGTHAVAHGGAGVEATWGKLREPVLRFTTLARALEHLKASGEIWFIGDLSNAATQLGQSPLRCRDRLQLLPPGRLRRRVRRIAAKKLVAPEFEIVERGLGARHRQLPAAHCWRSRRCRPTLDFGRMSCRWPTSPRRWWRAWTCGWPTAVAVGRHAQPRSSPLLPALPNATDAQRLARVRTALVDAHGRARFHRPEVKETRP